MRRPHDLDRRTVDPKFHPLWRQDDREDRTVAIPFEQKLALMLGQSILLYESKQVAHATCNLSLR
jgi:hypothetical protein